MLGRAAPSLLSSAEMLLRQARRRNGPGSTWELKPSHFALHRSWMLTERAFGQRAEPAGECGEVSEDADAITADAALSPELVEGARRPSDCFRDPILPRRQSSRHCAASRRC